MNTVCFMMVIFWDISLYFIQVFFTGVSYILPKGFPGPAFIPINN